LPIDDNRCDDLRTGGDMENTSKDRQFLRGGVPDGVSQEQWVRRRDGNLQTGDDRLNIQVEIQEGVGQAPWVHRRDGVRGILLAIQSFGGVGGGIRKIW
jgi:hypothetical protein